MVSFPQAEVLVLANQILYRNDVVDAFGHVSARSKDDPDVFLMSRSLAPCLVRESDILPFNLDGEHIGSHGGPFYLERYIHSEIYRQRPDVQAIVHSHSHSVIPFSISTCPLEPVFHIGAFLKSATPVFDIAERFGETDMLVRTAAQGAALAETLGQGAAVLMRGHGSVVVAPSLETAVARAVWLEANAKILLSARSLGPIKPLSVAEAELASAVSDAQAGRAWNLWAAEARKSITSEMAP